MHMRAHTLLKVGACNAAPAFLSSAESTANNSNAQLFFGQQWSTNEHQRQPHRVAHSVEIHGYHIKGHAAGEQEQKKTETDLMSILLCSTMTHILKRI